MKNNVNVIYNDLELKKKQIINDNKKKVVCIFLPMLLLVIHM